MTLPTLYQHVKLCTYYESLSTMHLYILWSTTRIYLWFLQVCPWNNRQSDDDEFLVHIMHSVLHAHLRHGILAQKDRWGSANIEAECWAHRDLRIYYIRHLHESLVHCNLDCSIWTQFKLGLNLGASHRRRRLVWAYGFALENIRHCLNRGEPSG